MSCEIVDNMWQLQSEPSIHWSFPVLHCCRYDVSTNELVCDKLGVAYPVINGVPNLVPQDGRLIGTRSREENT